MVSKTVLRWLTLVALVGLSLGVMVPAASAATSISACPFTITVPGNYEVTKNLTATGTSCIKVHSDNVAIDLKGHTIKGDKTEGNDGITDNCFGESGVAISHGKIMDFDDGIDFCSGRDISIDQVDSSDNAGDGIDIEGSDNTFTFVKADRNGGLGIDNDSSGDLFSNVEASNNKDSGIIVDDENGFTKVTASHNGDNGLDLTGTDNIITYTTANDNGEDGMFFDDFDNRVANSVANDNKTDGIDMPFGGDNEVIKSTTNHNGTDGVFIKCTGIGGTSNVVRLSAHGNGTNLSETGTCTNLLNNAP